MESFIQFLVDAKKNTYANNSGKTNNSRLASYDLEYKWKDFTYRDSYVGTHSFSGQEIVWERDIPVWSMNYYGDVLNSKFESKFLKKALMHPSLELPYRGDLIFKEGEYTYVMEVFGNFEKFNGVEKIFYKNILTYQLWFHGGKIIDKHFD